MVRKDTARILKVKVFIREKVWLRPFSNQTFSRINTPTFSNPVILHTYPPMKMEQTECSETSAYKIQNPGNYLEKKHTTYWTTLARCTDGRTHTHTHTHTFPSLTLFLEQQMMDIVQKPSKFNLHFMCNMFPLPELGSLV